MPVNGATFSLALFVGCFNVTPLREREMDSTILYEKLEGRMMLFVSTCGKPARLLEEEIECFNSLVHISGCLALALSRLVHG